jgi:hypothetical protein
VSTREKFNYQWYDPRVGMYEPGTDEKPARPAVEITVYLRDGDDLWMTLAEIGRAAALMGAALQEADAVRKEMK